MRTQEGIKTISTALCAGGLELETFRGRRCLRGRVDLACLVHSKKIHTAKSFSHYTVFNLEKLTRLLISVEGD